MSHKPSRGQKKTGISGKSNEDQWIRRLEFEMLLSELSNSFISVSPEEIDQNIESGLQQIVEFFGFERASLVQKGLDGQFRRTHFWSQPGVDPPVKHSVRTPFPEFFNHLYKNKTIISLPDLNHPPAEIANDVAKLREMGHKCSISIPLAAGERLLGLMTASSFTAEGLIAEESEHRFKLLGEIFANALIRKKTEDSLRQALTEVKELKNQLETEWSYLREEIKLEHDFRNVIGNTPAIKNVLNQVEQVAATDTTVLILGESGTGKEIIARSLHDISLRRHRALIKVDCASLPPTLIENELFGHDKGAFTGANEKKTGRLELANNGTLFLDEIGELPLEIQSKLLRAVQENTFERLGGTRTVKVDIRIIAATNRDLEEEVRQGSFREDLWYRLNVYPISIPPLRDRLEDIPLLVEWLVQQSAKKMGKIINKISKSAMKKLQNYNWPGNIRELENVITRAVITSSDSVLKTEDFNQLQSSSAKPKGFQLTPEEYEREYILSILRQTKSKIQGPDGAAQKMGIKPSTLRSRMKQRGIQRLQIFD